MIIFLTQTLYKRVYNELALKQPIPKWIGTQKLREYFKQIEPNIKFDGRVLSPTSCNPTNKNNDKCGIEISDSIFQELIDSSKYDYSIFWRIFTSFAEITDDDFKHSSLQEGLIYNYLNSEDNLITSVIIDVIIDYVVLKFNMMVDIKVSENTIIKIFNGTHKRYKTNPYYGKWKFMCDKTNIAIFNKIDIWLGCNFLEYSKSSWLLDNTHEQSLLVEFLNKLKKMC